MVPKEQTDSKAILCVFLLFTARSRRASVVYAVVNPSVRLFVLLFDFFFAV